MRQRRTLVADTVANLDAFVSEGPSGATTKLSALTPFEWDIVYYYTPYTTREEVEQTVGQSIDISDPTLHGFLVFLQQDEVVAVVEESPPLFFVGDRDQSYASDITIVEVATQDPGPYTKLRIAATEG